MKLSNIQCKSAEIRERAYKLSDGNGLYLEVMPSGKKYWRWQYRFGGKRPRISFGVYPEVALAEAREQRDANRKLLRDGIDPARKRRQEKLRQTANAANTFRALGDEWYDLNKDGWATRTAADIRACLDKNIYPALGNIPVTELEAPDVLATIRRIEARGATFLSRRAMQYIGRICRYAIATGRAARDPTYKLSEALKPHKSTHFASIEVHEIPEFVQALRSNKARLFRSTVLAVELIMLTFVRTSELVQAKWSEIDLDEGRWLIPAKRMKMGKDHIVPLSRQAQQYFRELRQISIYPEYVFPHFSDPRKHMSDNTILRALERLGYRGRMTGHGFRSLAMSAIKEKLGYRHEVIDRQLAHQPRSSIDKAYDRAQFIDERKVMMQEWADYIDEVVRKHLERS